MSRITKLRRSNWRDGAGALQLHGITTLAPVPAFTWLLSFNYFTATSRQEKSLSGRGISKQCTGRGGKSSYVAYMADKLFFATASEERNVSIMVFNRLEPNSLPRPLTTPVEHQSHEASVLNGANMIASEDLLAVLWCDTGNVSLWNGQSETWLSDIDMSLFIPYEYVTHEIAVSKDMLAVLLHVNGLGDGLRDKILFFRLNTSRPTADTPPSVHGNGADYQRGTDQHSHE